MTNLTFKEAQQNQPWNVPYAKGVLSAKNSRDVPHILGTHNVLHVAKTAGKLAAAFEEMDHPCRPEETGFGSGWGGSIPTDAQLQTIKDMSADLVTEALRFANLYDFDLAAELERRVFEKNGVRIR